MTHHAWVQEGQESEEEEEEDDIGRHRLDDIQVYLQYLLDCAWPSWSHVGAQAAGPCWAAGKARRSAPSLPSLMMQRRRTMKRYGCTCIMLQLNGCSPSALVLPFPGCSTVQIEEPALVRLQEEGGRRLKRWAAELGVLEGPGLQYFTCQLQHETALSVLPWISRFDFLLLTRWYSHSSLAQ